MTKRTHLLGGLAIAMAGIKVAEMHGIAWSMPLAASVTGASLVGSLIPDIDTPTSKAGGAVKPVSVVINKVCGHRGIFHSLLLYLVLVSCALWIFPQYYCIWLGLGAGVFSHLVLDSFNKTGVPLFWPYKVNVSFANIAVGGCGEFFVTVGLSAVIGILGWIHFCPCVV